MTPAVNTPNYLADNFSELKRSARVGDKILVGGGYVAEVSQEAETTTKLADDVIYLTAAGQLRGNSGKIVSVLCTSGSGITLTIYDNPISASGRVVHTASYNAGDFVYLDAYCINGAQATVSGASTFEITTGENV